MPSDPQHNFKTNGASEEGQFVSFRFDKERRPMGTANQKCGKSFWFHRCELFYLSEMVDWIDKGSQQSNKGALPESSSKKMILEGHP